MSEEQKSKGTAFRDLHLADGLFVMPNAWNAGSACMLEAAGFPAVGTTSEESLGTLDAVGPRESNSTPTPNNIRQGRHPSHFHDTSGILR